MISYQNDWTVFFTRPISGSVMLFVVLALAFPAIRHMRQEHKRRRIAAGGGQ
jgi:putative tricarboxylic transport membrane protein